MFLISVILICIKAIELRHVVAEAKPLISPLTIRAIQLRLPIIPLGAFIGGLIVYWVALLISKRDLSTAKPVPARPPPLPPPVGAPREPSKALENTCAYCGRTNASEAHACRECGTPLVK
ncbi:MAG TPA: hypothetical protein VMZ27_15460 [Candidatus Saccharimonadales bacterium]|nr:hypothetical protein [Candidatus Saccharimonadales bacterium]